MAKSKFYQRPDGLYEAIRVVNGKRKAFRGKTQREVERKMLEYQGEVEHGRPFSAVADEWADAHFKTLAPNTLKCYRPAYKRATEYFGDTPIKEIKAPDVKRFIDLFAHNEPGQNARAQKTVTTQLLVLNLIMEYAAGSGEIEYNPCVNVSVPKGLKKVRREAATPEDEEKVREYADKWILPFLVLYTGMRRGEATALTYGDIDLKDRTISVTKSLYHVDNRPYIKTPKTTCGVRVIPILDPLYPALKRLVANKRSGAYIFTRDDGTTPIWETDFRRDWANFVKETGVSCTLHQLRHSYASMLFECEVSPKDAQWLLGHANISTTQDIYTHIRDGRKKITAQLINDRLRNINANTV